MTGRLKYLGLSDEEVIEEVRRRLRRVTVLLEEIRDLLKTATGVD